jgi:predicted TIM-barrel fold metal-dependent hydrolase
MDNAGIDVQVLSHTVGSGRPFTGAEGVELARQANDQMAAAVAAHPGRFIGLATLPMTEPEAAVAELERAVVSLGCKGVVINGTTNGRFLDNTTFLPILEAAVRLDVPVYLHPAPPPAPVRDAYYGGLEPAVGFSLATNSWGWHSEVGLHALRLIVSGTFDRLPSLQVIIGHMGEMLPFMLARITAVLTPVATSLQRPIPEYFNHNFYLTTSGFFSDPPLLLIREVCGLDRVMFAVDYPFSTNQQGRSFLDTTTLSDEEKAKLCHRNAERLFKLAAPA